MDRDPAAARRRRRAYSREDKQRLVDETRAPGSSVCAVARKYAMSTSQLFRWRRLEEAGWPAAAEEDIAAADELPRLRARIAQLEDLLESKTIECEVLKDAIEIARTRQASAR